MQTPEHLLKYTSHVSSFLPISAEHSNLHQDLKTCLLDLTSTPNGGIWNVDLGWGPTCTIHFYPQHPHQPPFPIISSIAILCTSLPSLSPNPYTSFQSSSWMGPHWNFHWRYTNTRIMHTTRNKRTNSTPKVLKHLEILAKGNQKQRYYQDSIISLNFKVISRRLRVTV